MDAATIIANIKSQALVGNTGAADDDARVLRYLNKGYNKVFAASAQANPSMFQKFQDMVITDGVGLFVFPVVGLLSVIDKTTAQKLTPRTVSDIEEDDPLLATTGAPYNYDRILNGLITYPRNSTTLQLRYTPSPPALTADTQEIDILIPPVYHEVLEWAALYTLAYDERDKLVGSELQFTKDSFDSHMEDLKLYLLSQLPKEARRVRPC